MDIDGSEKADFKIATEMVAVGNSARSTTNELAGAGRSSARAQGVRFEQGITSAMGWMVCSGQTRFFCFLESAFDELEAFRMAAVSISRADEFQ